MNVRFFVFQSRNLGAVVSSICNLPYQRTEIEVFGTSKLCIDKASIVVWILVWLLRLIPEHALAVTSTNRGTALLNERRLLELLLGHSE